MSKSLQLVITCEHASGWIPPHYKSLIPRQVVQSHWGLDFGAATFAKKIGRNFKIPPHLGKASRLIADLNRSEDNRKKLFSPHLKHLTFEEKEGLLARFYFPFRHQVEKKINDFISNGHPVFHLSVHSFTPVLHQKRRTTDVGLLFDPERDKERRLCENWRTALNALASDYKVKFNYPYKGTSDGFTTYLRKRFKPSSYMGIELEINQKYPLKEQIKWSILQRYLTQSLSQILCPMNP